MSTKLIRFKVQNFRSIEESEWIDIADNSCLVGTNEAGKTNLLIALWKLKPANKEPIVPLEDFPRHLYSKYKADGHSEDVFIKADFQLNEDLANEIAKELKCDVEQCSKALVQRMYNGKYLISLPYSKIEFYEKEKLEQLLATAVTKIQQNPDFTKEPAELQKEIIECLNKIEFKSDTVKVDEIEKAIKQLESLISTQLGKKKNLPILINKLLTNRLKAIVRAFNGKPLETSEEIRKKILASLPKFVYYSDYGNLDSEIYLPRVIEDLSRDDLTESARAKARTLDVLFRYVKLSPQEIYELGNDRKVVVKKLNAHNQVISEEEEDLSKEDVQLWADKKKERSILLNSASSELTKSFKQWWLQGNYIFRFEADGNHFRINVSDELRPEEIELEGRSRGLQWFFSFFLVFLVETKSEHHNSVLLLDEPGLSLHPLAQQDLAKFFRKLSNDNQLIYTSHSPFLVDMDNLANVKAVFVDQESGRTKVSSNLRFNETDAEKSVYPVHAALGLTVSDTLLLGCSPVLVEGTSDQIYLSLIKRYLVGKGKYNDSKELVFIPTGGVRGMSPVTKLVSSREGDLPKVLLDSDSPGKGYKEKLLKDRYKESVDKVLEVEDFLGEGEFEIEDLIPSEILIQIVDRSYRGSDYFEDQYKSGDPIVDQIEDWAKRNDIELEDGWKVEIARECLNRIEKVSDKVDKQLAEIWEALFVKLLE